jgi:lactoylglutathione lyase
MELLHTCLNVADADRTADWYVDELGFERSWGLTVADGDTRNVYVADESGVELQLSDTPGEEPGARVAFVKDPDGRVVELIEPL